jgi:hypothetical protein
MPAFRDLEGVEGGFHRLEFQQAKDLLLKEAGDDDAEAESKKQAIAEATKLMNLSDLDRELIIRWLVKDYRVVFGGAPISAPPKR